MRDASCAARATRSAREQLPRPAPSKYSHTHWPEPTSRNGGSCVPCSGPTAVRPPGRYAVMNPCVHRSANESRTNTDRGAAHGPSRSTGTNAESPVVALDQEHDIAPQWQNASGLLPRWTTARYSSPHLGALLPARARRGGERRRGLSAVFPGVRAGYREAIASDSRPCTDAIT